MHRQCVHQVTFGVQVGCLPFPGGPIREARKVGCGRSLMGITPSASGTSPGTVPFKVPT